MSRRGFRTDRTSKVDVHIVRGADRPHEVVIGLLLGLIYDSRWRLLVTTLSTTSQVGADDNQLKSQ